MKFEVWSLNAEKQRGLDVKDISNRLSNKMRNMSFVCALLVILIHTPSNEEFGSVLWWCRNLCGSYGLTRIAVPYFFVASGFFLAGHTCDENWYWKAIVQRIRTLVVPVIIWTSTVLLYFTCLTVLANLAHGRPLLLNAEHLRISEIVNSFGLSPIRCGMLVFPLWYLRSLFLLVLISPALFFVLRKSKWFIGFAFLLYVSHFVLCKGWTYDVKVSWGAHFFSQFFSLEGLFYFCLGALLRLVPISLDRALNLYRFRYLMISGGG